MESTDNYDGYLNDHTYLKGDIVNPPVHDQSPDDILSKKVDRKEETIVLGNQPSNEVQSDKKPSESRTNNQPSFSCDQKTVASHSRILELLPYSKRPKTSFHEGNIQKMQKDYNDAIKKITPDIIRKEEKTTQWKELNEFLKEHPPKPGDMLTIKHFGYEHCVYVVNDDPRTGDPTIIHQTGRYCLQEMLVRCLLGYPNCGITTLDKLSKVAQGCQVRIFNSEPAESNDLKARLESIRIGYSNYSFTKHNCEHFVNYIRYGRSFSKQIDHLLPNFVFYIWDKFIGMSLYKLAD